MVSYFLTLLNSFKIIFTQSTICAYIKDWKKLYLADWLTKTIKRIYSGQKQVTLDIKMNSCKTSIIDNGSYVTPGDTYNAYFFSFPLNWFEKEIYKICI